MDECNCNIGGLGLIPGFGLIPRWVKWGAVGALGLYLISKSKQAAEVAKVISGSIDEAMVSLRSFLSSAGIEEQVAKAIMQVEAGGRTGFRDGKLLIRFEPHVFWRESAAAKLGIARPTSDQIRANGSIVLLPGMNRERFLQGGTVAAAEGRKRQGGQASEYSALAQALAIHPEAAYRSISMGAFQIMGFNASSAGYSSATEMFQKTSESFPEQYKGFMAFAKNYAGGRVLEAMKAKDWSTFASLYNGDTTGRYASRMAAAYRKLVG